MQVYDKFFVDRISEKVKIYKAKIESGVVARSNEDTIKLLPVPEQGKL